jgi:Ca2+-binding RTX toxin-like protein
MNPRADIHDPVTTCTGLLGPKTSGRQSVTEGQRRGDRCALVGIIVGWGLSGCSLDAEPPEDDSVDRAATVLLGVEACPEGSNVIEGTPGDDILDGTNGPDCILGHGGNDILRGGNESDVLLGGEGDDQLEGGNGDDRLEGEGGNDVLSGDGGADLLGGGDGNDVISGGNGDDTVDGGAGHDVVVGDRGDDEIDGGSGDDVIDDGPGNDAVDGGAGNDACDGQSCELGIPDLVPVCEADDDCTPGTSCALPAGVCVACIADDECDDDNPCTDASCQPLLGCSNLILPDGESCPDDTVCNGDETCIGGSCTPATPLSCNDGQFCNGTEWCHPTTACHPGTPPSTSDGVACTDDSCNEGTNKIIHTVNDAHCEAGFICEPDGCTPWCTQIEVAPGTIRCVQAPGDGSVGLHLSPGDMTPWEQEWRQSDEPVDNYCGPTAGKNVLFWYDEHPSYEDLALDMHTNEWEEGAALFGLSVIACGGDFIICAPILYFILSDTLIDAGSLPADVASTLWDRRPAGYDLCTSSGDDDIEPIRDALEHGSPVVYLESRSSGNLHWAVVTGLYYNDGDDDLRVRIANSGDRSWSDFVTDWSLAQVGDDVVKNILTNLGLVPYIRFYYTAPGQPCL